MLWKSTFLAEFQANRSELSLRKIPWFHLISWCGNFAERHSFRIVSAERHSFHTRKSGEITVIISVSADTMRFQKKFHTAKFLFFFYAMISLSVWSNTLPLFFSQYYMLYYCFIEKDQHSSIKIAIKFWKRIFPTSRCSVLRK